MTTVRQQKLNTFVALAVLACIIAAVCIIGILTFGKTDEIIQGQAEVSEYRVSSKISGRILEFRVHEGQKIKAGDTLAIIEAPEVEAKMAQAQAVRTAAEAQNIKAEKGAREEQIQAAYEMWQKAKTGREITEKSYNRINNLYKEGVVSEQKHDEIRAQLDAAIATEKAAEAQYTMAKNGTQEEDKEMAAAQVKQAEGVVAEVTSYVNETILTAYADGEITEIYPHVGELVGTGAPIMSVAIMTDVWATFNVREDYLTKMQIGTEFEAYIPALDTTAIMKINYMKDLGDYAAWKATKQTGQYDLKTFEVRATPKKTIKNLRPGMTVLYKINEK